MQSVCDNVLRYIVDYIELYAFADQQVLPHIASYSEE